MGFNNIFIYIEALSWHYIHKSVSRGIDDIVIPCNLNSPSESWLRFSFHSSMPLSSAGVEGSEFVAKHQNALFFAPPSLKPTNHQPTKSQHQREIR